MLLLQRNDTKLTARCESSERGCQRARKPEFGPSNFPWWLVVVLKSYFWFIARLCEDLPRHCFLHVLRRRRRGAGLQTSVRWNSCMTESFCEFQTLVLSILRLSFFRTQFHLSLVHSYKRLLRIAIACQWRLILILFNTISLFDACAIVQVHALRYGVAVLSPLV